MDHHQADHLHRRTEVAMVTTPVRVATARGVVRFAEANTLPTTPIQAATISATHATIGATVRPVEVKAKNMVSSANRPATN